MPVREGGRYLADKDGNLKPDAKDTPTAEAPRALVDPKVERVGGEKPAEEVNQAEDAGTPADKPAAATPAVQTPREPAGGGSKPKES